MGVRGSLMRSVSPRIDVVGVYPDLHPNLRSLPSMASP